VVYIIVQAMQSQHLTFEQQCAEQTEALQPSAKDSARLQGEVLHLRGLVIARGEALARVGVSTPEPWSLASSEATVKSASKASSLHSHASSSSHVAPSVPGSQPDWSRPPPSSERREQKGANQTS